MVPEFQPEDLQVVFSIPPLKLHPMQKGLRVKFWRNLRYYLQFMKRVVDVTKVEHHTSKSALKYPVCTVAIKEELSTLHSQGTRSLVHLPPKMNLGSCK